jgi:hypothetical protein
MYLYLMRPCFNWTSDCSFFKSLGFSSSLCFHSFPWFLITYISFRVSVLLVAVQCSAYFVSSWLNFFFAFQLTSAFKSHFLSSLFSLLMYGYSFPFVAVQLHFRFVHDSAFLLRYVEPTWAFFIVQLTSSYSSAYISLCFSFPFVAVQLNFLMLLIFTFA